MKSALHCRRPQPCKGGSLAVPIPKPAQSWQGVPSTGHLSRRTQEGQAEEMQRNKDSIKVQRQHQGTERKTASRYKELETTKRPRDKGCYMYVSSCPYWIHKTWPEAAAQTTGKLLLQHSNISTCCLIICASLKSVAPTQLHCLPSYTTRALHVTYSGSPVLEVLGIPK